MELALTVSRFVQFSSAMLLWGGLLFRAALCPPQLQAASADAARKWGTLLALVNLIAGLAWLAVEAAMLGGVEAVVPLLLHTHFGQVFGLHLLLSVGLAVASLKAGPRVLAGLAGAALASLALTGHAAMRGGGLGLLHQASAALHLLAAGAWVGGLVVLLPCLGLLRNANMAAVTRTALRRYSRLGQVAVGLVFATGALNAALIQTARGGFDPNIQYVVLLAIKVACVSAMLGLAVLNRYVWVPRLGRDSKAVRAIESGTLAEIGLAAAALILVSLFATFSPFAQS